MNEVAEDINKKTSISLSRNSPVALVVGAAGFLGSHLVDRLLEKGIQVAAVDNLDRGKKEHLREAAGNKNFHLVIEDAEKLDLDLERLDYLFIVSSGKWNLDKVLELLKKTGSRCLLVSSIELYEKENLSGRLAHLKEAEAKIARFAKEYNLNARILRLGPVYGPRMDFESKDPIVKLIHQALSDNLQSGVSLDFSSRALFVDDATDLVIRTIFAGSTAQKIFDGVLPAPVKVEEVKQVLLDPVWYESRDFQPAELPPWPTPNLEKTKKTLNWHPKAKLVASLRQTLSYFRDNEIAVAELEGESRKIEIGQKRDNWKEEKKEELKALRRGAGEEEKVKPRQKISLPKFSFIGQKIYTVVILLLIGYALIWPIFTLGWGVLTFRYQLSEGIKNLEKGDFQKSLANIAQAQNGAASAKSIYEWLEPVRKTGIFKKEFELGDQLAGLSLMSTTSARATILGVEALFQSVRASTGEITASPAAYFSEAQVQLTEADEALSKAHALLQGSDFKSNLPQILQGRVKSLSDKLSQYSGLVKKGRILAVMLPEVVSLEGSKNYLILLQNNMELRPGGGFIGSFAKVSFEGGKLKALEINDIYAIDGQLNIHVEPPKEIKEDLGQKDWFLRDSNWEADFPTAARQAEWFYAKETGERVDGVVALDVSAIQDLISVIGSLNLSDYSEKITPENLFERSVTHSEAGFFPGSQAKKSFLTALTNEVFNKIFFLPQTNWPGIVASLGRSLDQKHISVYLDDLQLFSYLSSQGWTHVMPRGSAQNKNQDFLSLVEANLGANKVNYYLDRNYDLETVIGKDGEVKHRLRISYTNKSPSQAFPGGKYKNRMRVYLPFGSKLERVLWGESDITQNVKGFVDFGRSGFSFLLELSPKETKTLVLDYEVPVKLEFKEGRASYRLDILKQAGTLKDPLKWTITYPINYQVVSNQAKVIGPQEQTISTDLSKDRSFEVDFKK